MLLSLIAQTANSLPDVNSTTLIVAYGPMGIMLAWFMWRFEAMVKAFRGLSHTIDGMTKAMLVEVMSRPGSTNAARQTASEMLSKMEQKDS